MPQLSNNEIDLATREAEEFLRENGVNEQDILRIRLSVEETLLRYQEQLGEEAEFALATGKSFGNVKIRLSVTGPMMDPYASTEGDDELNGMMRQMLLNMGQLPSWSYSRGKNIILFTQSGKRLSSWAVLLITIAAAILCGLLVRTLPEAAGAFILQDVITPLLDTFFGFINAIAGPMIFLSVVSGIYSLGNVSMFSVLGKKLISHYLLFELILIILAVGISLPFFSWNMGGTQGSGWFSPLFQMVLDIIPDNLFTPFTSGNNLQILFLAVIFAVTLIVLGEKTAAVAAIAEQLGLIINAVMGFVAKLIPGFIFCSLLNITAGSRVEILKESGIFVLCTLLECLFVLVVHTAYVSVRLHYSTVMLWKNSWSTFLIGLTTSSSAAALADNLRTCTEKYHVSKVFANFAVPLGQILYKPALAILFYFAAVSVVVSTGTAVSVSWFVIAIILCMVLACASAPVQGGSVVCFSILLVQLGLPMTKLPVILALSMLLDYCSTATNLFAGQCVLLDTANSFGLIEEK